MYRKGLIVGILTCIALLLAESILFVYLMNDNHNNLLKYKEIKRQAKDLQAISNKVLIPEVKNHGNYFIFIHKIKVHNKVIIYVEKLSKTETYRALEPHKNPSGDLQRVLFRKDRTKREIPLIDKEL